MVGRWKVKATVATMFADVLGPNYIGLARAAEHFHA